VTPIEKPENPADVPDFINTMRTANAMFAPASPYIKYDPYNPEHVGTAIYDGKYHLYVLCQIGSHSDGCRAEAAVRVAVETGAVEFKVNANFGAAGEKSPAEMAVWAEMVQHVAQASCRVEAYLKHEFRGGFLNPKEVKAWIDDHGDRKVE
jgi:hypothetical protein